MRQAFVDGVGQVLVRDVPRPEPHANGVLTQTLYSVISIGTESGWVKDRLAEPDPERPDRPLGYSNCGRVVAIGPSCDKPVEIGDLVVGGGLEMAAHAEYCSLPRNMFASVPIGVDPAEAALTTLGINSMHGVRQGKIELGDTVVVIGTGLIGQMAAQMARLNGGHVLVVGHRNQDRLTMARELGAERTLLSIQENPVEAVMDFTDGLGADVVLMCAATPGPAIMRQCLDMVRKNGRIVIVGLAELDVLFYQWHRKEAQLLISRAYGPGRHEPEYERGGIDYPPHFVRWTLNRNMQEFLRLVADKRLNLEWLITHKFEFEEVATAFDLILERYEETLGIVLRFPAAERAIDVRSGG
jgi:threonine dehydrogenase-like Zn-dependent dehydrogenase